MRRFTHWFKLGVVLWFMGLSAALCAAPSEEPTIVDINQAVQPSMLVELGQTQADALFVDLLECEYAHYYDIERDYVLDSTKWLEQALIYKNNRSLLWHYVSPSIRLTYGGIHPQAFTQLRRELGYARIMFQEGLQVRTGQTLALIHAHHLSSVALVLLVLKWLLVSLVLFIWLKRSGPWLNKWQKQAKHKWLSTTLQGAYLINPVLATYLYCDYVLSQLHEIAGFEYLQFVTLIIHSLLPLWLVHRVLSRVFERSRKRASDLLKKRLKRQLLWILSLGFVVALLVRFTELLIGAGALTGWLQSLWYVWLTVALVWLINSWQGAIYYHLYKTRDFPAWLMPCIKHRKHVLWRYPATVVVFIWLCIDAAKRALLRYLSRFVFFQQVLAYLFTLEVSKQSQQEDSVTHEPLTPEQAQAYISNEPQGQINYAHEAYAVLANYLHGNKPALCVLSAERGMGTTSMLKKLIANAPTDSVYLDCPSGGYEALLAAMAEQLGVDEEQPSETHIITALRRSAKTYLIAFDNVQRIVTPTVGGLGPLIKLTNLVRRGKTGHRVVFGIEKASWRFIDRARAERLLFDKVVFLPKWQEAEIAAFLSSRIARIGEHKISFNSLDIPKQWDHRQLSDAQRARSGFYRILWHYADGNPTIALRFFCQSLQREINTGEISVYLVEFPHSDELEEMPKPMLAILRSIVQLENASALQLAQCTQLTVDEVLGSMRFFHSRGFIEMQEQQARISDQWYRFVTNVLHQKHLLVK